MPYDIFNEFGCNTYVKSVKLIHRNNKSFKINCYKIASKSTIYALPKTKHSKPFVQKIRAVYPIL